MRSWCSLRKILLTFNHFHFPFLSSQWISNHRFFNFPLILTFTTHTFVRIYRTRVEIHHIINMLFVASLTLFFKWYEHENFAFSTTGKIAYQFRFNFCFLPFLQYNEPNDSYNLQQRNELNWNNTKIKHKKTISTA